MKTKILTMAILGAFLCASCDKSGDTAATGDGMVRFSSGIETKVGGSDGDQWDGTERIGIYMVKNGTLEVSEEAENVEYTTASTGTTAEFTSANPIYYPVSGEKVDFIAYHPYHSGVDDYIYPVDLSDQSDQNAVDLLVANADNNGTGYDKIYGDDPGNRVELEFEHQLAKVVMNLSAGDGVTLATDMAVVIEGMKSTARFDITTRQLGDEDDVKNLALTKQSAGYTYEAVLLPVVLDDTHVVKFTIGENTYTWPITDNSANIDEFEKGTKYSFDILIMRNRVRVMATILPWSHVPGGTGEAK